MAKKNNFRNFRTPVGRALFPYLTTPDTGKYAPDGGQYKVTLLLDPKIEAHAAFIDAMDAEAERCGEVIRDELIRDGKKAAAKALVVQSPIKPHFQKNDEGEKVETGLFEITAKRKCVQKNSRTKEVTHNTILLFDGAGCRLPKDVEVWGGSEVAVAFFTAPYYVEKDKTAGPSIKLKAVQVRKLVTRNGGSAEDFGFETDGESIQLGEPVEAESSDEPAADGGDEGEASTASDF